MTTKLSGVLGEIASVAGEPAAMTIAAHVGGTRVYIPAKADDDHWLVQAIGREAADKVCELLAGGRYDVPLGSGGAYRSMRRAIAKRVHDMDRAKKSSAEIARATGLTQRAVHRHRAKHRGGSKGDQGSLF
jgi:hypothetical protein